MVKQYLKEIAHHSANASSYVALAVAIMVGVIVAIVGEDFISGTLLGLMIAQISLVIAGYGAWKAAIDKQPKAGDFAIEVQGVEFGEKSSGGLFPHSPLRFAIQLEATNRSPEAVFWRSINVIEFDMGTTLLGHRPFKTRLFRRRSNQLSEDLELPFKIGARDQVSGLYFEVEVELLNRDQMEFAARLCEFDSYHMIIDYTFTDLTPESMVRSIVVDGSFKSFRDKWFVAWSGDVHRQEYRAYVDAAQRGGCV
jgi:hypothetical protein